MVMIYNLPKYLPSGLKYANNVSALYFKFNNKN
jgi:hypothetical protein